MTPEEQFDRVFASAMQDRQALLRFLDGVTAIQARWHPPDGAWSILEGLEHIMLTEEFFRSTFADHPARGRGQEHLGQCPGQPRQNVGRSAAAP